MSQQLSLLDSREEIYETVWEQLVAHVAFNEIRQAANHTDKNYPTCRRANVTFKQAGMLVDAAMLTDIINNNRLTMYISKFSSCNSSLKCYLLLDVFRSGTMQVEKRQCSKRYVQIE